MNVVALQARTETFHEVHEEGVKVMPDRRDSAWADPKTWISILGLLLTILILVGGVIANQLRALNAAQSELNASVHHMELTQAQTNTHNADLIGQLVEAQARNDRKFENQDAYNFGVNKTITEVVTTMKLKGLPTPAIPEPPKLGGQ